MLSEVALLCRLYRIIADYFQRPRAMDEFAWVVDDYNKSFVNTMAIRTNNEYCAIWLANILAAYWMYVGAQQVVREENPLPLGGSGPCYFAGGLSESVERLSPLHKQRELGTPEILPSRAILIIWHSILGLKVHSV